MKKLTLNKLAKFTDPKAIHPYCISPFQHDTFTYATNGHVIVRVDASVLPAAPYCDTNGDKVAVQMERVMAKPTRDTVWRAVLPVAREVAVCSEVKRIERRKEKVDRYYAVKIGEAHIQLRYWNLIASLPDAEIGEVGYALDAVPFRFAGGIGTCMPIRM